MFSRKIMIFVFSSLIAGAVFAEEPPAQMEPAKVLSTMIGFIQPNEKAPDAPLIKSGDRVSFVGDSITAYGGYVRIAAFVLKTGYPEIRLPEFVKSGTSGAKAEDLAPRFEKDSQLAQNPKSVFLSEGMNDVLHRTANTPAIIEAYRKNVTDMVDKAQGAGAKVILMTPTVVEENPPSDRNKRLAEFANVMKEIAAVKNCGVLDLHAIFLEAIAKKPASLKLTKDGIHMNLYGDTLMAIGILRALGVPDSKIASIDPSSGVKFSMTMPIGEAAGKLQVPVSQLMNIHDAVIF